MCSWTATISSSSAGMVPSTVLTLVIRSLTSGVRKLFVWADGCLAHGQQVARVVHEDALGVLVAQALVLEEGCERGHDVAERQVVVGLPLGHADRVARKDDFVGMAGRNELEHQFGPVMVGEVVRVVVQAHVVDSD